MFLAFGIVAWFTIVCGLLLGITVLLLPFWEKIWIVIDIIWPSFMIAGCLMIVLTIIILSLCSESDCAAKSIPLWGFLD